MKKVLQRIVGRRETYLTVVRIWSPLTDLRVEGLIGLDYRSERLGIFYMYTLSNCSRNYIYRFFRVEKHNKYIKDWMKRRVCAWRMASREREVWIFTIRGHTRHIWREGDEIFTHIDTRIFCIMFLWKRFRGWRLQWSLRLFFEALR